MYSDVGSCFLHNKLNSVAVGGFRLFWGAGWARPECGENGSNCAIELTATCAGELHCRDVCKNLNFGPPHVPYDVR